MYVKIEYKGKKEMHDAKSYNFNYLGSQKADLNIHTKENGVIQRHFEDITKIDAYVMNENGKTIDKI